MTDFVISNNLVVFGMSTFTGGLTFDGAQIIDVDDTEALLVRKDGDGGDVFTVNTVGDIVTIGGAMRASGASGHAFGSPATNSVLTIDTTSTADGGGTNAAAVNFFPDYTGDSGLTDFIALMRLAGNIQTQTETESIANISTLAIDEPGITDNLTGSITNAQTLLIEAEPTEGVTNAALRVAAGHVILPTENDASTPTLAFGDGDSGFYETSDDTIHLALIGQQRVRWNSTAMRSLTAGGWELPYAATTATEPMLRPQDDSNTGYGSAAADQLSLIAGGVEVLRLSNATEFAQSRWSGAFTSDGSSNLATGALFAADITNASGDVALSQVRMGGTNVGGSLTTSGAGDSILACTLWLDEPDITLTPSDSMTTAATLYISGAPSEGTSANFALFIDNGAARFDGVLDMKENSTFSNPAKTFTFGSGVAQTYAHVAIIGAFTSSGLSNQAAHLYIAGALTGASGDTVSLAGLRMQNTITTQGASQTITDVAQAIFVEPVITVGSGDTVTNAQTVLIASAPTEGSSNYALRVASGDVLFSDLQFAIGEPDLDDFFQVEIGGNFLSGGSNTFAATLRIAPGLIGAAGDTGSLTGTRFETVITTQTATESITDIAQVRIAEPAITDNLTGSITNAQTLLLAGSPTEGVANYTIRSTGAAPTLFQGLQFVVGTSSVVDYIQLRLTGTFTSGGASDRGQLLTMDGTLVGASGDTNFLAGAYFDSNITTQTATESIADISQVRIDEPNITDNLTGTITTAHTLLLAGSPTEGAANFTIRSTGDAPTLFQGLQYVIGTSSVQDYHQFNLAGSFTSGGAASEADKLKVEGSLTGAAGDSALSGAFFAPSIITQTATETVADIATVRIQEPSITDNLTGDITNAQVLLLVGSPTEGEDNFVIRTTGAARSLFAGLQFSIGTNVVQDVWQVQIRGNFTSGGASNRAAKFEIEESLIGVSGDTVFLGGASFDARITTQTAAEVVADVFQVRIDEPEITLGAGSSITNASSLLIAGAPTEGVTNDALRIVSGSTQFPQGSAAAPSIRFGNVGTGIYQATTNDVLVTIDGVSLIKVTDAGSVNRLSFHSDLALTWTSGAAEGGGPQFALIRETTAESQSSVGDLALSSGADFTVYKERGSSSSYHRTSIRHREETLSNVSGASVTTTITAIPDGALVLGVTTTVEVALGTSNGTTGYQVGDGTDADRWGDITGTSTLTESDDADFTVATVDRFTSSGEVTITAVGGNFDGTGDILVVVHFLEIGANRP